MPNYVVLGKWTNQGIQSVKQSPSRLDAGRNLFAGSGVKLKDFYMTMGRYDMVLVGEAPDDATFAKAILTLASTGNVQTETLRAFPEDEYRAIISGLA
ncbi:GYD domain-containing protein [Alloacidobacterium sp.]|uniref:GYD domain-containing protein n=1 Tax=Alloacidobacterium sp. TaxID=2951999 RepID=UPI002D395D37|nr:GYD domain-containing protein [Alloacidobacterium sp.]HYK37414.1 GYD domain-containing protein [Alloacidobacterium sp.]